MNSAMQPAASFIGFGHYLPDRVVDSHEVEAQVSSNGYQMPAGIIERLSGVTSRRYAEKAEASSDMAAKAGINALQRAQVDPLSVDVLMFAAASQDISEPATANIVQEKTGCYGAHVFDIKNACNSFLNAVDIASSLIQTGRAKRILITSGEVLSPVINWDVADNRDLVPKFSALTLGDGGGACLMEAYKDQERGIYGGGFSSDGRYWRLSTVLSGGTLLKEDLSKRFFECESGRLESAATRQLTPLIWKVMKVMDWDPLDIDHVVPHQVSLAVIRRLCKEFEYPIERCMVTVDRLGNIAAASIPVALSLAIEQNKISPGDKMLLIGAAAGISAGVVPVIY